MDSILRRKRDSAPPGGDDRNDNGSLTHEPEKPTKLTDTEIRLDSCLKLNQGRVIGYRELIGAVWGGRKVSLDTLHYYVRRLKSKLLGNRIVQQRGFGYLWAKQKAGQ